MVSLTFAIGTPSFCALTRSISTKSCGVFAVKGENTCVSPGALRAAATSSSLAAANSSGPRPWRSWTRIVKPPPVPIPGTGGGGEPLLQAHFRLLEHREESRSIARLRSGRAREAGECCDANDARCIQRRFLDLTDNIGGARQRRRARQLRRYDDVAAVLRGNKTLRRRDDQPACAADQRHIQ